MPYRVGEFAALTGVTVRALQHYDHLGLLTPQRTNSGHRVYSETDRRRVQHILALRALGMSLQQVADLLNGSPSRLPDAFRVQRTRLEQSRAGIEEAIRILQQLDEAEGEPVGRRHRVGRCAQARCPGGLRPRVAMARLLAARASAAIRRVQNRRDCEVSRRRPDGRMA